MNLDRLSFNLCLLSARSNSKANTWLKWSLSKGIQLGFIALGIRSKLKTVPKPSPIKCFTVISDTIWEGYKSWRESISSNKSEIEPRILSKQQLFSTQDATLNLWTSKKPTMWSALFRFQRMSSNKFLNFLKSNCRFLMWTLKLFTIIKGRLLRWSSRTLPNFKKWRGSYKKA